MRGVVADLSKVSVEADLRRPLQGGGSSAGYGDQPRGADSVGSALDRWSRHHRLGRVPPGYPHARSAADPDGQGSGALPPKENTSSLVFTSGSVASKPDPGWAILAFVAGGMVSLAKGLAVDLAPVRVNVVQPGYVDTGLWAPMGDQKRAEFQKMIEGKMPTGKFAQPEDVAEAYLWLLKDANVTGTVAATDAGQLLV